MTSQKNKVLAFIRIDSMIDIITNSSSELFVIENKMAIPVLVEMTNTVLSGTGFSITESCVEKRLVQDQQDYETEWKIDEALALFPENVREELKAKYLTEPNWYGISFDRDDIHRNDQDIRGRLTSIGYELIDTDY
jgi:hypothetical protein